MPTCTVTMNVPSDKSKDGECCLKVSQAVAEKVGKPEKWVMVHINSNQTMSYSGTLDPCAFCHLVSIGTMTPDTTKALSKTISDILQQTHGIPCDRVYIEFADSERHMFGWNGGTF